MEQKCQIVRETSTSGVIRSGLIRSGLIRSGAIRSAAVEGRESVPAASVPSMSVPAVSLPSQSVPAESLPYERLSEGVDAARGSETVSYQASESVLFAYNESVLLPAAGETLDAILADARAKGFNGPVKVEGHTDDTGPDAGNQALSEAKAGAGQTKRVLRDAMQGIMPDSIRLRRSKIGLNSPFIDWFNGGLRALLKTVVEHPLWLDNPNWNGRELAQNILAKSEARAWRTSDWGTCMEIWTLIDVVLWQLLFVEGDAEALLAQTTEVAS